MHLAAAATLTLTSFGREASPPSVSVQQGHGSIRILLAPSLPTNETESPEEPARTWSEALDTHLIHEALTQAMRAAGARSPREALTQPIEAESTSAPTPTLARAAPPGEPTRAKPPQPAMTTPPPSQNPPMRSDALRAAPPQSLREPVRLPEETGASAPSASAAEEPGAVRPALGPADLTPTYPPLSRRMGEEGVVVLDVRILPNGRAGEIRVRRDPGHRRLIDAAIEAVREAEFTPAKRGDDPVGSWLEVRVRFALE